MADHKTEITRMIEAAHRRNLELDALHYVWCSGGCASGVHRWHHEPLTEEIVVEAERNARRLRAWLTNAEFKKTWAGMSMEEREEWYRANDPHTLGKLG